MTSSTNNINQSVDVPNAAPNNHTIINMMSSSESDSELSRIEVRRDRLTRRWMPPNYNNINFPNSIRTIMYRFTPLFRPTAAHGRLTAYVDSVPRGEPPPVRVPILHRTQSLTDIASIGRDPLDHIGIFDSPNRIRPIRPRRSEANANDGQNAVPPTSPATDQERQDEEEEDSDEHLHVNSSDLLALLPKLFKYAPVFLILFTKFIIDHMSGILSFLLLIFTFYHTNNIMKTEGVKPTDINRKKLFIALVHSVCCIVMVDFIEGYWSRYSGVLIMMPMNDIPSGLWEMLWVVTLSDCFLRLVTIDLKIIITVLPWKVMPFKKKGKVFCFLETSSQLYRSIAPIQPWLFYLLNSYNGYGKIISVILTSAYIISKGFEIIRRAVVLRKSFDQLLKSTNIGVLPNKEQIEAAGVLCPICHEQYTTPVLLNCSHIFCEMCVSVWLNKVQTCPLCRAQVVTSSTWRNGATSQYFQLY